MNRPLLLILAGLMFIAATLGLVGTRGIAAKVSGSTAVFDSNGRLKLPIGYRRWIFLGAPLTPNGLNNGKAGFPEYHHVYVEERNLDIYLKTGSFPEGTVIVKELTRVLNPSLPRRFSNRAIR